MRPRPIAGGSGWSRGSVERLSGLGARKGVRLVMNGQESRMARPVSEITEQTHHGQYDRRAVIRRAMALGLAAPLVAAMLEAVPVAAQEASPAAAPAGDPIKIGSPYNLTGGYASIDNPAANGSRLAVKEINEAGGVLGRPLEIIIEDGKSDVPTITSVAKKLVEEDGVHVMAGLTDTSYMLAAGPVAQEAGIPFLDVGGTAPLITTVGDFIFMLPFGDNVQAAVADRKSTRLNSSHLVISYAVFCLKKKTK